MGMHLSRVKMTMKNAAILHPIKLYSLMKKFPQRFRN